MPRVIDPPKDITEFAMEWALQYQELRERLALYPSNEKGIREKAQECHCIKTQMHKYWRPPIVDKACEKAIQTLSMVIPSN